MTEKMMELILYVAVAGFITYGIAVILDCRSRDREADRRMKILDAIIARSEKEEAENVRK